MIVLSQSAAINFAVLLAFIVGLALVLCVLGLLIKLLARQKKSVILIVLLGILPMALGIAAMICGYCYVDYDRIDPLLSYDQAAFNQLAQTGMICGAVVLGSGVVAAAVVASARRGE